MSLFDNQGLARRADPDTSQEAAAKANVGHLQAVILRCFDIYGSMTADAVSLHTGQALNTISPRMRQLADKGYIRDSGQRRATRTGRKAIVWELVR